MVEMVILGETEAHGGEATCVDSSSSQVTKLGLEPKSSDSKRHVKRIGGLFAGQQTRLFLWRVFGVSGEARETGMNLFITLGARCGSLVFILGQFRGRKGLGFRTTPLGAGRRSEEEGDEAWLEAASRAETRGVGSVLVWAGELKTDGELEPVRRDD